MHNGDVLIQLLNASSVSERKKTAEILSSVQFPVLLYVYNGGSKLAELKDVITQIFDGEVYLCADDKGLVTLADADGQSKEEIIQEIFYGKMAQ